MPTLCSITAMTPREQSPHPRRSSLWPKGCDSGADFNDPESTLRMADSALAFLGGIDCLVNNAGITLNRPFLKMRPEQLDTLLNVNFRTPYLLTQRMVEPMVNQGFGAICNLLSIHGLQGAPEYSAYAATKGAIAACTRSLAVELGFHGVRVNAIAPGWIMVENHATAIPGFDAEKSRLQAQTAVPVAHYGLPIDIARMAAYLCLRMQASLPARPLSSMVEPQRSCRCFPISQPVDGKIRRRIRARRLTRPGICRRL